MARIERFSRKLAGWLAGAALALAFPIAVSADTTPSYATGAPETIHGTIATITGKYTLTLSDDRGFTDRVTMHDGTVIAPTGITLVTGQEVTIVGHTDGNAFDADEIDTDGAEPDASRPGAGYYTGPYDAGLYAPYVIPLGGGGYYYGNGFGGYGGFGPYGGFGQYGGFGPYGGYGAFGGYYYSNPGYVPPPGSPGSNLTPISRHPTPVGHAPIGRPRPPLSYRYGSSGSLGAGARSSSSHSSSSSSHR